jgi:hypothetical protein
LSDVGNTPQFEAPTLAELARQINDRPLWEVRDKHPLPVDPETYQRGLSEMREVQSRQGRPVAAAGWLKQPNFLLHGIPVVISNDL